MSVMRTSTWLRVALLVMALGAVAGQKQRDAAFCESRLETCDPDVNHFDATFTVEHMTLVNVTFTNTYADVDVNPGTQNEGKTLKYRVIRCGCPEPPERNGRVNLLFPVKSLYVSDTVIMAQVAALPKGLRTIVAMPSVQFVSNPEIHRLAEAGNITEIGSVANSYDPAFNSSILPVRPSLSILNGFEFDKYTAALRKSRRQRNNPNLRSRSFVNTELSESSPLGRAEYILLMGMFLGQIPEARAIFDGIVRDYEAARSLSFEIPFQPSTMVGFPFGNDENSYSWFFPNQDSYPAQFLVDSNVDYRFQSNELSGSGTLTSNAEVLGNFSSAQFWVNAASFMTIPNITVMAERLAAGPFNIDIKDIRSVQCNNLWANDNDLFENGVPSPTGMSNNFFEEGVVRPDLILRDLVSIFYPGAIPDHEFKFYRKLDSSALNLTCPLVDLPATPAEGRDYIIIDATATNTDRFAIEDILVTDVIPDIAEEAGVDVDDVEVNLRTLRTADTTADMNITISVPSNRSDEVLDNAPEILTAVRTKLREDLDSAITLEANGDAVKIENSQGATPTPAPTEPPAPADDDDDKADDDDDDGEAEGGGALSGGAIAGIVIGSVVALCLVLALFLIFGRRRPSQE